MDKRQLWGALGLSVLLCGCTAQKTEPTPTAPAADTPEQMAVRWLADENHRAFSVGDFWVTLNHAEEEKSAISIWNPADLSAPLQTMEQEIEPYVFGQSEVVDANFDGYPDFGCVRFQGNQPQYWNFWLWDETQGRFVEEPALSEISAPQFDAANGIVSGYARAGWAGAAGEHTFYQWMDGQLTLIRRVETSVEPAEAGGEDTLTVTVEDRRDGALTQVFRQTYPLEDGGWWDVQEQWCDLYYQGV